MLKAWRRGKYRRNGEAANFIGEMASKAYCGGRETQ